ncbi:MAG TPA: DUF3140 domain-containing protein [Gaiellaceae bacterium]|nr:DUF3140 domain-containing protein [Gaiellaceae bacterium]
MRAEELQRVTLWFQETVNLEAEELEAWLETEESRSVGWRPDGRGESVGHASGRRIVRILRKPEHELTDGDYQHMVRVVGFVHRHLAQRPAGDVRHTRWRHSLLDWGHDPLLSG